MISDSAGIYMILNTINNNKYIGSAVNLRKRWNNHQDEVWINNSGDAIHWDSINFSIHTDDLIKFVTNCQNII